METKRLARSQYNRIVAGVAGGVANYLGFEALWVRIGFIALTLLSGWGILLYLSLWLLLPAEQSEAEGRELLEENIAEMQRAIQVVFDRLRNVFQ